MEHKEELVEDSERKGVVVEDIKVEKDWQAGESSESLLLNSTFCVLGSVIVISLLLAAYCAVSDASIFHNVATRIVSSIFFLTVASAFAFKVSRHYFSTSPNEWVLVIKNGALVRAGIGLTGFRQFEEVVVSFPSSIQKIDFSAQQVTTEVQGIEVKGFAIYSIYRSGEGPFKAFKYLKGMDEQGIREASGNIRMMAESIIRHQIANMTIAEVLRNRNKLRDRTRKDMLDVVKGWGLWLETVEVTEVRILSKTVFEDMQQEFRSNIHKDAEKLKMATDAQIQEEKYKYELQRNKKAAETDTQSRTYSSQQELKRQQEEEKTNAEVHRIRLAKLLQDQEFEIKQKENVAAVKEFELEAEMRRRRKKHEADMKEEAERMELEAKMTDVSLKKYSIDKTTEIYKKLPVSQIKIINSTNGKSLDALLPGLASSWQQITNDD